MAHIRSGRRAAGDSMEARIEQALDPGEFVSWRELAEFTERADDARAEIAGLIAVDPARAGHLLETFLAACHAKADEVDDDGPFGNVVAEASLDWIRAHQAAGGQAEETVATLRRWMQVDEYGFFSHLHCGAVAVLDAAGVAELERLARADLVSAEPGTWRRARAADSLREIHAHRKDTSAYEALAIELGGPTPKDCEALARMHLAKDEAEAALAWVCRALALPAGDGGGKPWDLEELRREILLRAGRPVEALDTAWGAFCENPDLRAYEELRRYVPPAERASWHAKALEVLEQEASLDDRIHVLAATREAGRLAQVVEGAERAALVGIPPIATEPAAALLAESHPLLAAKLRIALALRLLATKDTSLYASALRHLETVRELLSQTGHGAEWRTLLEELRTAHRRKSRFLPGLERLAAGGSMTPRPFLDRARERWDRKMSGQAS